jgi:hypothetical protein
MDGTPREKDRGQTPALATLCLKLYNRTKPCMANERFNNDILYAER